jgi:hypothetical protein
MSIVPFEHAPANSESVERHHKHCVRLAIGLTVGWGVVLVAAICWLALMRP